MNKKKVYISGAISGLPRAKYLKNFERAERILQAYGWKTVNPTRFLHARWPWLYKIIGYRLSLLIDLWMLSKCGYIYVIRQHSQKSIGVRVEKAWAAAFGIDFLRDASLEHFRNTEDEQLRTGHIEG